MASGQTGFVEVINTAINTPFTNAANYDLVLRTDQPQQKLLLGNNSNSGAGITLSNNYAILSNPPIYNTACAIIYPSTFAYTSGNFDYFCFSNATITNSNFMSININPNVGYSNSLTLLQPGRYHVYMQVTPSGTAAVRMGYAANYYHTTIVSTAGNCWGNPAAYDSTNNSGIVSTVRSEPVYWNTVVMSDVFSNPSAGNVLRFLVQFVTGGSTVPMTNFLNNRQDGATRIIVRYIG